MTGQDAAPRRQEIALALQGRGSHGAFGPHLRLSTEALGSMKTRAAAVLPIALLWAGQALAQSAAPLTNTGVSKEAENPVTRQITLPLRYQADLFGRRGPSHQGDV
jgi:hypothetical protein